MKKLFVILLTFSLSALSAQNLSVTSFIQDETDLSAITTPVIDQNGNKCALIKIETNQSGFSFDVGLMGIVKIEKKVGEYWLYVPAGIKYISIFHDQLDNIRDYALPVHIYAAKTYVMTLKSTNITTLIDEKITQQWLIFEVKPSDAIVTLDGEALPGEEGVFTKFLQFGTYSYTIQARDYHTISGTIEINNPEKQHILPVNLLPAFGYLTIPAEGDLVASNISIDGKFIGAPPIESLQLSSGTHTLTITKVKYKSVTTEIVIKDGKVTLYNTQLKVNFAPITITAIEGGEIWIDGKFVGISPWSGNMEYGSHRIECHKQGHAIISRSFDFAPGAATSLTLAAPTPTTGSLNITSSPALAEIFIDGTSVGRTPLLVNKLLAGTHSLRITKQGYGEYNQSIIVTEGKTVTIFAKLQNSVPVVLSTTATNAHITLDNVEVTDLSAIKSLSIGDHVISIVSLGYKSLTRTFTVSQNSSNTFTFSLESTSEVGIFTVKGVSFRMIPIKGGTFTMGSPYELDSNVGDDEMPVHNVTLSSYLIGETEVTQELWEAVMGSNPSNFTGYQNPVENVSWEECQDFISKLNSLTGKIFRLPTEAEWEFAARGGNKSADFKYSGSNDIGSIAWYKSNSGSETHMVKTKSPNELGIYDMSGNVYEWCNDWYGAYPSGSVSNPSGSATTSSRVVRGGSFYHYSSYCRITCRYSTVPSSRSYNLGLRLAL